MRPWVEVKICEWKLIYYCVLGGSKAVWCNGCEASRVDDYTKRGLRSSRPLRVVAIQTIDIFIRQPL